MRSYNSILCRDQKTKKYLVISESGPPPVTKARAAETRIKPQKRPSKLHAIPLLPIPDLFNCNTYYSSHLLKVKKSVLFGATI